MTRSQQIVSINTFRIKSQHAALFRRFFHVWRSPYIVVAHSHTNAIAFRARCTCHRNILHSTSKPPHIEIVDPRHRSHRYRSTSHVEDRVSTQRRSRRHTARSTICSTTGHRYCVTTPSRLATESRRMSIHHNAVVHIDHHAKTDTSTVFVLLVASFEQTRTAHKQRTTSHPSIGDHIQKTNGATRTLLEHFPSTLVAGDAVEVHARTCRPSTRSTQSIEASNQHDAARPPTCRNTSPLARSSIDPSTYALLTHCPLTYSFTHSLTKQLTTAAPHEVSERAPDPTN